MRRSMQAIEAAQHVALLAEHLLGDRALALAQGRQAAAEERTVAGDASRIDW